MLSSEHLSGHTLFWEVAGLTTNVNSLGNAV